MLGIVFHTIVTAAFLLYSQSLLVMWCLYFVEKQDIVLYFCPDELGSTNPFAGARYVHEMSDAQRGQAEGALSLITIVERSVAYTLPLQQSSVSVQQFRAETPILHAPIPLDGYSSPPFVPPRLPS